MTFGERLLLAIRRRGITQSQLATMSGINDYSISQYVHDKQGPNADNLVRLAEALEVPPDWLYLGRHIKMRPLRDDDHDV